MEQERIITLDLTGCKYLGRFIRELKRRLIFPIFTGKIGVLFGICYEVNATQI